jgi:hypothetical protein
MHEASAHYTLAAILLAKPVFEKRSIVVPRSVDVESLEGRFRHAKKKPCTRDSAMAGIGKLERERESGMEESLK